ncbi:hypothetical protein BT96DRAFT_995676 [Gymnopus androsaceus JB14]|uniref:F-box domain-containing protein n=1 Tax=Gymnopus androsaceus JB14 TaxID=1447944 RepID=A0A6A4HL33_9AGAR|nr:hypothetical protein BT96DRAFT_995676 [Gymnopus androsaceus JB14]
MGGRSEDEDLPFASVVRQMPSLENLAITNFNHPGKQYTRLELGWENLTQLTLLTPLHTRRSNISQFSPGEILTILGRTCCLQSVTLIIDISNWDHASTSDTAVVNLPAMHEMHITFINRRFQDYSLLKTFFLNFFHSILCPSLKTLSASWQGTALIEIPFSALVSLQDVEALSLNMPLTPRALLNCLSLVPNLRSLEIVSRPLAIDDGNGSQGIPPLISHTVEDTVLESLASNLSGEGNHTPLQCPNLKHIKITFKDSLPSSITLNALLAFLESHVQAQTSLESCNIFFPKPPAEPTEEEAARLQALVDSGLKLQIQYQKQRQIFYQNDSPLIGVLVQRTGVLPQWQDFLIGEPARLSGFQALFETGTII